MKNACLIVCVVSGLCAGLSRAGTREELRAANREAMRNHAKAALVRADTPAPAPLRTHAAALTNRAAVARLKGAAESVTNAYAFVWHEDRPLLFPELEARRPTADSYFGALERRIAAACATNDLDAASGLVRRYVYEWDNVYKVQPRQ